MKYDYFDHLVSDANKKIKLTSMAIQRLRVIFKDDEPNFRILENFKITYLDSLDERQELSFQLVVRKNNQNQDLDFYIQKPSTRNIKPSGM